MKASWFVIIVLVSATPALVGYQNPSEIQKMEASGDSAGARAALARAAQSHPDDPAALTAYAEFLERYGDPGAREAYSNLLAVLRKSGNTARAAVVAKRLAVLDLIAGDRPAASNDLEASGRKLAIPVPGNPSAGPTSGTATLPGPMRSFARMAALSPDA